MGWLQRVVWGNKKVICRQIQASLICRQPPFSGLLRNPRPAAHADPRLVYVVNQTRRNPTAPEMTALAVNNAQRYSRISKSDRIELARFRSSFVLRRISGALDKSSLFNRLAEIAEKCSRAGSPGWVQGPSGPWRGARGLGAPGKAACG